MSDHIGRSWTGHHIEDDCPCVKAPCGLVSEPVAECTEHAPQAGKTIRQRHPAFLCPAVLQQARADLLDEIPTIGVSMPPISSVFGPCPECGEAADREPYDIGSGPELSCSNCEWCWGLYGQELRALVTPSVEVTRRALEAHREGRQVSLNYETGVWTIDGAVQQDDPTVDERAHVVARKPTDGGWQILDIRPDPFEQPDG